MVRDTVTISSIFSVCYELTVAPSRGRGLKHQTLSEDLHQRGVAPSRGRGLKRLIDHQVKPGSGSPLHGGVD